MKKLIIDTLLTIALAIAFLWVAIMCEGAELTAPETCNAGELAIVRCSESASWTVYPQEYQTSFYVVEDGKTLVFSSPNKGSVTFIAATVEEGVPVIAQKIMYNGVTPDTKDEKQETKTDTLEGVVTDESKDKTAESLTALAESFEAVVSGIERGTVTTVTGARETFRGTWTEKAVAVNPELVKTMAGTVTKISAKIDNATLDSLKKDYATIATTIRKSIPAKKKEVEQPKQAQTPCASGKCPTCPNGNCYRWGW